MAAAPTDATSADQTLQETWIAVANDVVMTVYHGGNDGIGFARGEYVNSTFQWLEFNDIPKFVLKANLDPCIAGSPNRKFLAAGLTRATNPRRLLVTGWNGVWAPWATVLDQAAGQWLDKPWLIHGNYEPADFEASQPEIDEYYLTYAGPPASGSSHYYFRTANGGVSWVGGPIQVNGQSIQGTAHGMQPTTAGAGPLYVAYVAGNLGNVTAFRFLKGTDAGPLGGGVTFEYLKDSVNQNLVITTNLPAGPNAITNKLPGDGSHLQIRTTPWLLADPTDADRLFLVYHDVETVGHPDVNVCLQTLEQTGGTWSAGTRHKVNTEDGQQFPHESDQFMPSATAAVIHGEVHILALWYDDRRLATPGPADPQPDGPATAHPKFDVFYADITFLPDGTPDIANHELVGTDPDIHALDYELFTLGPWGPGDRPGDYNGIAVRNNVAYTSFFGTNPEDVPLNDNPSTIWSSRIPFAP